MIFCRTIQRYLQRPKSPCGDIPERRRSIRGGRRNNTKLWAHWWNSRRSAGVLSSFPGEHINRAFPFLVQLLLLAMLYPIAIPNFEASRRSRLLLPLAHRQWIVFWPNNRRRPGEDCKERDRRGTFTATFTSSSATFSLLANGYCRILGLTSTTSCWQRRHQCRMRLGASASASCWTGLAECQV